MFDVKFDRKNFNFGLDAQIYYAKTDPFFPFEAVLIVYLQNIDIQILRKNNWYDSKLCLTFRQSSGLK